MVKFKKYITFELFAVIIPFIVLYLMGLFDVLVLINLVPKFMKPIAYFMTKDIDCDLVAITSFPLVFIFMCGNLLLLDYFLNKNWLVLVVNWVNKLYKHNRCCYCKKKIKKTWKQPIKTWKGLWHYDCYDDFMCEP